MIRNLVLKRVSLYMLAFICLFSGIAHSATRTRILVLLFEVHSKKDLSYLGNQIPDIISKQLENDGGEILLPDESDALAFVNDGSSAKAALKLGKESRADLVVWGSFTRAGDKISLDVRLIDIAAGTPTAGTPTAGTPTQYSYAEGDGIENLPATVSRVAMDLGVRIFNLESIDTIRVEGNARIESDAILRAIKTKPGDRFHKGKLTEDLKSVYAMGYFEDIRIESEKTPGKKGRTAVIFKVTEKPTIRNIKIKGNHAFDAEKIKKSITITKGAILNSLKIKQNISQIVTLYDEKNYHNTTVDYKIYQKENNQADLEFIIKEGNKVLIKDILFEGNIGFTDKQIRKLIKTKRKGFFSWLTSSGALNMADLDVDVAVIGGAYQRKGYIDVRIAEPQVEYRDQWIYVTIKIDEGSQYKVGSIDIAGDVIGDKEKLISRLRIAKEEFCNKEVLQNDVILLTDLYSDDGYAMVDINPSIKRNIEAKTADITFVANKGELVHFEKIVIGGNLITRDKVIRRQLDFYEQELYSGRKLKQGVRNLHRLEYFEDVKVNTTPGSAPGQVVLNIDVKEKPTGTFTFGMGYSSQDKFFGTVGVSKRNLFGRDQTLNLQAEFGSTNTKFTVSFIEPWLFDIPLYSKVDLKNWKTEYSDYDKDTKGGGVTLGYPVFFMSRAFVSYAYENTNIDNVESSASETIKDLEGFNATSSMTFSLKYDSRDRRFNAQPTRGGEHSISVEHAGGILGGDFNFSKYRASTSWFYPLLWKTIGFAHGEAGFIQKNSGGEDLPDYEKFYLGGINAIRGFRWQDIHAEDDDGLEIGGDKYVQFNVELLHPLFKTEGLVGLVFADTGNVFGRDESIDFNELRSSYGFGFRWFSPIGPIRFERGYIYQPKDDEPNARWEFSMGGAF